MGGFIIPEAPSIIPQHIQLVCIESSVFIAAACIVFNNSYKN